MIFNCHTHIGDAFIKLLPRKYSVEELVAPPHGYKHVMLKKASREEIVEGMRKAIDVMEECGTDVFVDFREGGRGGVEILREAMEGRKIKAVILSRPSGLRYDEDEIDDLLDISHGIGLSSVSDWDFEEVKAIAEHVESRKKIFAIHASENKREDIEKIIELHPLFVVHLCRATEEDIKEVIKKGIGVVICPRANAFFGLAPPVNILLEHGAKIMLGTDNAMIVKPDIMEEKKYLMQKFGVDEEEADKMVTSTPAKLFGKFI